MSDTGAPFCHFNRHCSRKTKEFVAKSSGPCGGIEFLEMDGKPSPQALMVCGTTRCWVQRKVVKEQSGKSCLIENVNRQCQSADTLSPPGRADGMR